jgi:D-3-phosphoglycerate dehydrogenase
MIGFEAKPTLLIAEGQGFPVGAEEILADVVDLRVLDLTREQLLDAVCDAEILWVRLRHRIDQEIMQSGRRLRLLVSPTTGLNHIDLCSAQKLGIEVLSLRGQIEFLREIRATAEHTIGLMLSLLRRIPAAVDHVRNGGWDRDLFRGQELFERTIGVVGYGRLGKIVCRYLKAFGSHVLTTDPRVDESEVEPGVRWMTLPKLLRASEIVTLHVDLCPENEGFFGERQFRQMLRGAMFINTSRGEVIDESALLDALSSGHLGGAALDVLKDEEYSDMSRNSLVIWARKHDNLLITPHIGGCTSESMEKAERFLAAELARMVAEW